MAVLASGHKLVKCGADGAISGVEHDETLSGNGTSAEPLGALLENVIFDDSILETDEDGNTIIGVNPVWVNYIVSASGGDCHCSGKLDVSSLNMVVTGGTSITPEQSAYFGINYIPFQAKYDGNGNVINETYLFKSQFNSGAFVKYDENLKPLLIGSGNSAGNGNAPKVAIGFNNDIGPESFTFGKNNINYGECPIFGEKNEGWDKSLLVGYNNSSQHCALNVGANNYAFSESLAVGDNISADNRSISVGNATSAINQSFALGNGSLAWNRGISVGTDAFTNSNSLAIGNSAFASGGSLTIGNRSTAWRNSVALGDDASAYKGSFAFGESARCANTAIAIGNYTSADWCGVAVGEFTEADAFCVAVGANSKAYDSSTIAIGHGSMAMDKTGIAIGFANYSENSGVAIGSQLHAGNNTMVFGSWNSSANSAIHGWVFASNPFDHPDNVDALTIDRYGTLSARGQVSGLDCVSVGTSNQSAISLRDLYNAFTAYTASHP